jgi:hypothetical protein
MMLFIWELWHYSLAALAVAVGAAGGWLSGTGGNSGKPGRFAAGLAMIIVCIVLFGIFQDMRLDHLCAIHGNCT